MRNRSPLETTYLYNRKQMFDNLLRSSRRSGHRNGAPIEPSQKHMARTYSYETTHERSSDNSIMVAGTRNADTKGDLPG